MDISTANRLYEYRKKSGLSQEELASKLGVSRQAVSKWERAEASPDTDNLINLAKIYNVTLDELIYRSPDEDAENNNATNSDDEADVSEENTSESGRQGLRINAGSVDVNGDNGHVHVGWDGVYIKDGKGEVHIEKCDRKSDDEGFTIYDNNGNIISKHKPSKLHEIPVAIIITALYFIISAIWHIWHPAWLIFLLIPVIDSVFSAIERKNAKLFCFPVFITFIYLLIGFVYGLWHPWWVLFITIPLYYSIVSWIRECKNSRL